MARAAAAHVEAQPDETIQSAEPTMTSIRVHRLNGELLEVSLTNMEANKLEFNRDLKRCLANKDSSEKLVLAICWIRLVHIDTGLEIADEDRINWQWLQQGSLQYVVADVMSFALAELPPSDDLLFCYADLDQLLDPKQLIACAYWICKKRGQAFCEHVFPAWKLALLALPHEEVNAMEGACEMMLLNRCLSLLEALYHTEDFIRKEDPGCSISCRDDFHDKHLPGDPFEDLLHRTFGSATIELVKQKVDAETIEKAFNSFGYISREKRKNQLWTLVQGEPCLHTCNGRRCNRTWGDLRFGLGAELMMALIEKDLPRWCWAGCWGPYTDTLLQNIIAPVAAMPIDWDEEDAPKAQLCAFLAERFTLQELCHADRDGMNALAHVEEYCDSFHARFHTLWFHVRAVITQQMEARVCDFPGSLLELIELARSAQAGLGGDVDSLDALPAFGEQMWHRAAAVREEWLRMGWIFAAGTVNGQISEVLNWHVDAVGRGIRRLS